MIHLMKLELKKVRLTRYVLYSIIGIVFGMFFLFVGLHDDTLKKLGYEGAFRELNLIFLFYYVILFAVLNVAYIINEYTNKTILVLFAYPIDRRKLILAKLLLITALIAVSMIVGYLCCGIYIVALDKYANLISGTFQLSVLKYWIPTAIKAIIVYSSLGIWTFVVGMMKKSISVTLVSSIVFIYIRQFILSGINANEENLLCTIVVLGLTAAAVYFTLKYKVTKIDG